MLLLYEKLGKVARYFGYTLALVFVGASLLSATAYAAKTDKVCTGPQDFNCSVVNSSSECNASGGITALNKNNCKLVGYIVTITNVMSALVAVVIVGSIVWGGILYTSAGSDPGAVANARNRIRNAIIALLFYLFTFAFIQWLIPGGIL